MRCERIALPAEPRPHSFSHYSTPKEITQAFFACCAPKACAGAVKRRSDRRAKAACRADRDGVLRFGVAKSGGVVYHILNTRGGCARAREDEIAGGERPCRGEIWERILPGGSKNIERGRA